MSCVSQCLFAQSVLNVPHVATEISVGGRLQSFWQVWQRLGSNPRVVSVLRDGYILPFRERPHLSHFPLIVSKYASPSKNKALLEALASLIQKQVVEKVVVRSSLAFYNRLFLVPKPNRQWRPFLDLSKLNLFLTTNTFKMETPETIRLSLQRGEWVMSLDFSDAYFHIPIAQRSRKYLRFHLNKVNYQFTSLPFGLATAPLEFKLMAQARGIRIHQYLDDWLLRAPCQATCLLHTQTLLALCQELGWVVNMKKSELTPQQVFNFVGHPQLDLFATQFNHKLPRFVSPVPDQKAWAIDALSLPWRNLDAYAFPPVSLLNQVISKVRDQGCRRMILIAPGWPNMPWFWDLVTLSVQIPFQLPCQRDLVTQPFNGLGHRNLSLLTLHAWLLEPWPFRNRGSARAVYKSKWAIFIRRCDSHEVDFRSPSVS